MQPTYGHNATWLARFARWHSQFASSDCTADGTDTLLSGSQPPENDRALIGRRKANGSGPLPSGMGERMRGARRDQGATSVLDRARRLTPPIRRVPEQASLPGALAGLPATAQL
jgi:hypothetical protein